MSYDLRDLLHFGNPVGGALQPNPAPYDQYSSLAYCSNTAFQFFCPSPANTFSLQFEATASVMPARAQLVYDIRSVGGAGTAALTVNGTKLGLVLSADSVPGAIGQEWVHRSVDIDLSTLRFGTNNVRIDLKGTVQLDRMHVELSYPPPPPVRTRIVKK